MYDTIKNHKHSQKQKPPSILWTGMELKQQGIKNISLQLFEYTFIKELNLEGNQIETIPKEILKLKNLQVLILNDNKISEIPKEIGMLTNLKEFHIKNNKIKKIPYELGNLYQLEVFDLTGNPLENPFKDIYRNTGCPGIYMFCRENNAQYPPPLNRIWISREEAMLVAEEEKEHEGFFERDDNLVADGDDSFYDNNYINTDSIGIHNYADESLMHSIGSYNILSDHYVSSVIYGHVPLWALKWEYRRERISFELHRHSFDILCLQEIETQKYIEYFRNSLANDLEYESIFYPKTRSKILAHTSTVDGCATFWKKNKYRSIEQKFIEFTNLIIHDRRFQTNPDIINRNMQKDNVGIITVLETIEHGNIIVVANVHLTWDPGFRDVKLIQSIIMLEEVSKMKSKYPRSSILVVGDFNSLQDSGVYEFITKGSLRPGHPDFCNFNYYPFTTGANHDLKLNDTYKNYLKFTNFTPNFTGTIDYIFFNERVHVDYILGNLDETYTKAIVGIPSVHVPSDHIVIGAKFSCKSEKIKTKH